MPAALLEHVRRLQERAARSRKRQAAAAAGAAPPTPVADHDLVPISLLQGP